MVALVKSNIQKRIPPKPKTLKTCSKLALSTKKIIWTVLKQCRNSLADGVSFKFSMDCNASCVSVFIILYNVNSFLILNVQTKMQSSFPTNHVHIVQIFSFFGDSIQWHVLSKSFSSSFPWFFGCFAIHKNLQFKTTLKMLLYFS